jgi:hypothetical protein
MERLMEHHRLFNHRHLLMNRKNQRKQKDAEK